MDGRAKLPPHTNETIRRASRAEKQRVRDILARDKADAAAERFRREAEVEFEAGKPVMMADAVVPPTREQLASGEFRPYTPRQPDGSVRVVRTVRRVLTPAVQRLRRANHIGDKALAACLWYRHIYELAHLDGRYSTTRFSDQCSGEFSRRTGGTGGHIAMTLTEAEARRAMRAARAALTQRYLRFFDRVVIDDVPIYRSYHTARCSRPRALVVFCEQAERLAAHCEAEQANLRLIDRG